MRSPAGFLVIIKIVVGPRFEPSQASGLWESSEEQKNLPFKNENVFLIREKIYLEQNKNRNRKDTFYNWILKKRSKNSSLSILFIEQCFYFIIYDKLFVSMIATTSVLQRKVCLLAKFIKSIVYTITVV